MIWIAIFITLSYVILIGSFIYGMDRVKTFSLGNPTPKTRFSVVVPFRNEVSNLPALLASISKLNYPKALFEIVLVDDDSEDGSVAYLNKMLMAYAPCDIRLVPTVRNSGSPKKDAITQGILQSKYDWVVTTDADCELPKYWLDVFDGFIQEQSPEFIVAPVTYSKWDRLLYRFQLLDILSLQGTTMGAFGIGRPMLCNGANLAYTKQLFDTVKGFCGNDGIASGDDIFMLEKVARKYPEKVKFLKSELAIVTTVPQPTVKTLISQRVRWAAKTGSYRNGFGKLTGLLVFLMNGSLIAFGAMALLSTIKPSIVFFLLVIKFIVDFLLLYKTATFTGQKAVMRSFPWAFFIHPFFIVYVVFASVFKGYQWKGRHYFR